MLSIALVALGIVYLNETFWPKQHVGPEFAHMPKMLITLGILSLFASVMGCYISRTDNKRRLRLVS